MTRHDAHIADCALCQRQLADPQPFHDDLCHMDINPENDYGDREWIQCPHLAEPGGKVQICMRHLEGAHAAYVRMVARTAPLN